MTDEKICSKLKRWGAVLDTCYRKQQEIQQLKQLCIDVIDCGSPTLTGMPKARRTASSVEQAVERIIDTYEKEISRLSQDIEKEMNFKINMDEIISRLLPLQQKVITLKYFHGHSWRVTAQKMNYSKIQCQRLHNRAFEKMIQNDAFLVL